MRSMPLAVVDLGTNTFNLLLAEAEGTGWRILQAERIPVKLLENSQDGAIEPTPYQRGIEALMCFKKMADEHKVHRLLGVATSGLRSAKNGADFLEEARLKTGMDLQVIDGNEEARLIYLGVRQAVDLGETPKLIVDIGGGSVEFIFGNSHQLFWRQSFPVGVARLKSRFHHHEPMLGEEQNALLKYLDKELSPLLEAFPKFPGHTLIGSSGSFESLANILSLRQNGQAISSDLQSFEFQLQDLKNIHQEIVALNLEERLQIEGLVKYRADMMVVASLVIYWILDRLPMNEVKSSSFALREGQLAELLYSKD